HGGRNRGFEEAARGLLGAQERLHALPQGRVVGADGLQVGPALGRRFRQDSSEQRFESVQRVTHGTAPWAWWLSVISSALFARRASCGETKSWVRPASRPRSWRRRARRGRTPTSGPRWRGRCREPRQPVLAQVQYLQGQKPLFFAISPYLPMRVFP